MQEIQEITFSPEVIKCAEKLSIGSAPHVFYPDRDAITIAQKIAGLDFWREVMKEFGGISSEKRMRWEEHVDNAIALLLQNGITCDRTATAFLEQLEQKLEQWQEISEEWEKQKGEEFKALQKEFLEENCGR